MNKSVVPHEEAVILPFEKSGEFFVERLGELRPKPGYELIKRIFDLVASMLALVILLPVMLLIAIVIKCTSKGTVLYRQERLGLNGKKIWIVKFRTMHMDAEQSGAQWSRGDEDPRIFPFGQFLRRYHIDELPQLVAIIKGDLSIIGPRPERAVFYEEFETYVHGFSQRLKVKPGLTGLAQINGGYNLKPEEKILYDIEYIKTRTLWLEVKIIFRTIGVVLDHKDAK